MIPDPPRRHAPSKEWRVRPEPPDGLATHLDLPPFRARLLYNRGIRHPADIGPYLDADSRLANDPLLLPDMNAAVSRLQEALAKGEVVGVFGDFDTDGMSATALMTLALQQAGSTVVSYLPDRVDEGHGLNDGAVRALRSQGVSLLITVDCGSSSVQELALASSLGMDAIVTDHHSLPAELPDVVALVNPRRGDSVFPFHGLTGAGLAFKLAEALYAAMERPLPEHLVELAALGTVADVAPLEGENRYIVKAGLERIRNTLHPGIRALIERARLSGGIFDVESLSFGLIPRLNAAGRLSDASLSLDLLTAPSPERAAAIADKLEAHNQERRRLTREGVDEAIEQMESRHPSGPPAIIFEENRQWLPGILGLIAGKLAERYYRPAIAVSVGETLSRGSARTIPEFNIVDALRQADGLFKRYGGHPEAAGFTIPTDRLAELKRVLNTVAEERLDVADLTPFITIDCEISPEVLLDRNVPFILSMGPFGRGNPAPVFLTRQARVVGAQRVGRELDHLKLRLAHNGKPWPAIAFGQGDRAPEEGSTVDFVYTVGLDDWGHEPTIQLNVLDFRPSE